MNKYRITYVVMLCGIALSGCQSGGGGTVSPTPAPSPSPAPGPSPSPTPGVVTLTDYLDLLTYAPSNQNSLKENLTQQQQTMSLTQEMSINNISINFYSDSQCSNLTNTVSFGGSAVLRVGSYTTTTNSNLALCSEFSWYGNTGCVYAYSYSQSLNFVVSPVSGSKINGACMTNSAWNGERIGYYNSSQNWSRNCSTSANCGFSQHYTMTLN